MSNNPKTIEDKLGLLQYRIDEGNPHITVDQEKFKADSVKAILFACPAKVYVEDEQTGDCIVNYENCIECGTCHVVAPEYVNWFYPEGGKGVHYRYG